MKMKLNLTKLFDNNRFVTVFAVVAAVLLYIIVAVISKDTVNYVIRDVPVNLDLQTATLNNLDLYVVEGGDYLVDITINGPRTLVSRYGPNSPELATTARITNVNGPGTYPMTVISAYDDADNLPFTIERYDPSVITVRLDSRTERTLSIIPYSKGFNVADGYSLGPETVTPSRVTISGPEADVSRVASAEVTVDLEETLTQSQVYQLPIVLRDEQGNEINIRETYLDLDVSEAELLITVYKVTGLPLEAVISPTPRGFPVEELMEYMNINIDYVMVEGPESAVNRLTEIKLDPIDLRELRPGHTYYRFNLTDYLSDSISIQDGITEVMVNFDDTEWSTMSLNLGLDNIQMLNVPADLDVEIISTRLEGVEFVGVGDALEELTADDVLVEIDFSDRELSTGQQNYPVKISVPGKGLVWALESKTVPIRVTEK